MSQFVTDEQWRFYEDNGYLNLGNVLGDNDLAGLQARIDEIMLGTAKIDYDRVLMQLDSGSGKYGDLPDQTNGWKGATLDYRKIQNLEHDALFWNYLNQPIFAEISAKIYGADVPIACYRAMFMNKPARAGTLLPWHQDAWTNLDRQPEITVWTALDPATIANGCVQVVPGSHKLGRVNPDHPSGFLNEDQMAEYCPEDKTVYLELPPGGVVLLHNWLLHRSDVNGTDISRRGFSVCYMDARTQSSYGEIFTPIFTGAATPSVLQPV